MNHDELPTECIDIDMIVDDLDMDVELLDIDLELDATPSNYVEHTTSDYRKLSNKPTINGTELFDNYDEIDPTVPDWAKTENKPEYTADEINAVNREDTISEEAIHAMVRAIFYD